MIRKMIFRLDDISWDMDYKKFIKIRDLFFKYEIKPIIGVIPNNKDTKLVQQSHGNGITKQEFWNEIRTLQRTHGWSIALHGYEHNYISQRSGMFNINKRSEFAGLPLDVQREKIKKGKQIFEREGIQIDAFMAPAHSLDWNTVRALKDNSINVVTDGQCLFPYIKRKIVFVPQVGSWPTKKSIGVCTICFHINNWDDSRFAELEKVIVNNCKHNTDFNKVVRDTIDGLYSKKRLINALSAFTIRGRRLLLNMKR